MKRPTKTKSKLLKPSAVTDTYWLHAKRKGAGYPGPTENCGKWLIFVRANDVDTTWEKIRQAAEDGKLGNAAKVATAMPNPNARDPNMRVICVYTYDWTDESDVHRIRQALCELGITWKIPYKADQETHAGKYSKDGHRGISKYYE
jgi:Domain of unknown function (DUF1917)